MSRRHSVFFFFILFIAFSCSQENQDGIKPSNYYTKLPVNEDFLQQGDIILRKGSGILSDYIVKKLEDSLAVSHCGIITKKGKKVYVIHSILSEEKGVKGITKEPIGEFIQDALMNSLVIVRQKQSEKFKLEFVSKAEELLKESIPFDPMFDIRNQEKMYCTEIVWHISKTLLDEDVFKKKIKAGSTELLSFDNFFNSDYFEVVYSDFE